MSGEDLLVKAVALLILFYVAQRRINLFIQPLRLRMVELGEELIADKRLPEHYRLGIEMELNFAYSGWNLVLSIIFLPITAIAMLFKPKFRREACNEYEHMPKELRREFELFLSMSNKSMYAANPLLTPLYLVELVCVGALVIAFGRSERAVRVIMAEAWENEDRMISRFHGNHHKHAV